MTYLRKNPDIFEHIAKLDKQPGISVDDVKIASQLAGDSLVLSDEDLKYLQEVAQHRADLNAIDTRRAENNKLDLKTHDLVNAVQQIRPNGLTFAELMNLREDELALEERELQSLRFLRSPTVSKVLEKLVTPYNNMVTPEVLRVLTSLLWNPAIYGATPIVFFQTAPLAHETDVDPVANLGGGSGVRINRNKRIRKSRVEHPRQVVHLEAHHIMDICHRLSPDGNITLAQLRDYEPQNEAEEKALNLLRQTHIFQALAGLEHEPDYLNDNDIKLALAEGALVLSDPFIVLVILP